MAEPASTGELLEPPTGDADAPTSSNRWRERAWRDGPIVLIVAGIFLLCLVNQRPGHDWGDDFALYIRQGASIVDGNVGEVLDTNRFTIDNSSWHTFSPDAYPWGWPLLIAPIYAIWGIDYGVLKAFEALLFAGFLLAFRSVTQRRTNEVAATLLVLTIGLSVAYVGWTDTALSEFPYLCSLGLSLWGADRCVRRGPFVQGRWWPLAVLGLGIGFTYSIRREGLALLAGLGLLHLAMLGGRVAEGGLGALRTVPWRRLVVPYASAVGFVAALQLVLPSVLFQKYPDAGLKQVKPNVIWFRDILGEQIGLKTPGVTDFDLLGSRRLALFVLAVFVTLAVIGVLVRAVTALATDAMVIGYTLGVSLIIGVQPFHEGRYLLSITPFMAYFAYQAVVFLAGGRRATSKLAPRLGAAFLAIFVLANAAELKNRTEGRLDTDYYVVPGPEDPEAQELFAAIDRFADSDDVIGFFRARAMNLYSGLRSVQVTTTDDVLRVTDLYAMERNSTYSQVLLSDEEAANLGLVKLWENVKYVLWRVAPA